MHSRRRADPEPGHAPPAGRVYFFHTLATCITAHHVPYLPAMEAELLELATEIVHSEFLRSTSDSEAPVTLTTPETLHRIVAERVYALMQTDFSKLMASLYQIDVDEGLVGEAFRLPSELLAASELATLIIAREVRKAESRAQGRFS